MSFDLNVISSNKPTNSFFTVSIVFIRMTKNDVKQYLEKIYKIDVLDVTTIIKQGLNKMNLGLISKVFSLFRKRKSSSGDLGNHRS
jgi:ribosomal protein L23